MKVVVVCESMFGNTEAVAREVRDGLVDAGAEAELVDVREAIGHDYTACELLVIGAPTHALSLSRPETRAQAVEKGADPARAKVGIREWLEDLERLLPALLHRPAVAVFDTRSLQARHWPGSAASRASRKLRSEGFTVLDRSSFYVDAIAGPLVTGEGVRARAWGAELPDLVRRHDRADHGRH